MSEEKPTPLGDAEQRVEERRKRWGSAILDLDGNLITEIAVHQLGAGEARTPKIEDGCFDSEDLEANISALECLRKQIYGDVKTHPGLRGSVGIVQRRAS